MAPLQASTRRDYCEIVLKRLTPRHWRIFGLVVIVAGIPFCISFWVDRGWVWGAAILGLNLYLGAFLAFAIPWLQARKL
jgi:hypothetical protein